MMFLVFFLLDSVIMCFRIFFFFNVGHASFDNALLNNDQYIKDCKFSIITTAISSIISIYLNLGMMFCRFIYARYASGLELFGKNLFHGLVCIVSGTFCLQGLLFMPVKNIFLTKDYPLNIIQGQICTKTIIQFSDGGQNKDFSLKPKLIVITFTSLIILSSLFFSISSQKQAKRHGIPKKRRNLMTIHHQNLFTVLLCICGIATQIINFVLKLFSEELGIDYAFIIWWTFHLLTIFITHVGMNVWIFLNALKYFEEFNGLVALQFPGQEKPKPIIISPRREYYGKTTTNSSIDSGKMDIRTQPGTSRIVLIKHQVKFAKRNLMPPIDII